MINKQKHCTHCGSPLGRHLSVESAAELLDCSQQFFRNLIRDRLISFVKVGRLVRIPYSEIEKLIEYYPSFDEEEKRRLRTFH